jgi:dGTPase
LFSLGDIAGVELPGQILAEIRKAFPGLDDARVVHEFIRRMIGLLIEDVVAETGRRVAALAPRSADDVRAAPSALVGFSSAVAGAERLIKDFLETRMYRHARIKRVMNDAADLVRALFRRYIEHLGDLPAEWSMGLASLDEPARARRIADFIAGMTDRYALAEHARLFDSTPELR